jgi:hypothetical protein
VRLPSGYGISRSILGRVVDRIVEVDGSVHATDGGYSAWLERQPAAGG